MNIDFIPAWPVALSLLAAGFLPAFMLALSHGPWKVAAPGRRFIVAAVLTVGTWIGLIFLPESPNAFDVVAGALLLLTALLAGFTLWTLIAWGFTLSMLLTLARSDRPLSLPEWVAGYTGGKPLTAFARDRLGVLLMLGLATSRDGRVAMTPVRGRWMARIAGLLRSTFGLPK
ncbi:MAG: hypothetical protein U0791_03500 [Gemmataceae bacterium]